jgi:arsenate reductase (glutaredoxin)
MKTMNNVTIFHNPQCGTSRNTLAIIRHAGIQPEVIEYLKTPPSKEQIRELVAQMQMPVRQLLREKEIPFAELGLADSKWTDDQLLDFIHQHPILMNRTGCANVAWHEAVPPLRIRAGDPAGGQAGAVQERRRRAGCG